MRVLSGVVARYQPIVATDTREVELYETLARRKRVPTELAGVVLLAEEYGLSDLLDVTMLRLALDELRKAPELRLSVNVSVLSVSVAPDVLLGVVEQAGVVAQRLVVEIVETVRMKDPAPLSQFVRSVRQMGAQVALDDYGSGRFVTDDGLIDLLRPEWVKLSDTAVAAFMLTRDVSVVRRLLRRLSPFGGRLIAEHVDAEEKLDCLIKAGVSHAQGFLFGQAGPLPLRSKR